MSSRPFPVVAAAVAVLAAGCGDAPSEPESAGLAPPPTLSAELIDPLRVAFDDVALRLLPAMDSSTFRAIHPAFRLLRPALASGEVEALELALRNAKRTLARHTTDPDAAAALLLLDHVERALDPRPPAPATKEKTQ